MTIHYGKCSVFVVIAFVVVAVDFHVYFCSAALCFLLVFTAVECAAMRQMRLMRYKPSQMRAHTRTEMHTHKRRVSAACLLASAFVCQRRLKCARKREGACTVRQCTGVRESVVGRAGKGDAYRCNVAADGNMH